jgi:hypothetical membrane protein
MKNGSKWQIGSITGLIAIIIFLLATFTALALFSGHYTPLNNWLSDLGNSNYNPQGAIFFNLGCIATGILLIPFFIGLSRWKFGFDEGQGKDVLTAAQVMGVFSSLSLVMIGIFPETLAPWHWIWSAVFFLSLPISLILVNLSLWNHPRFMRKVTYYGLVVIVVDLFFITIYKLNTGLPRPLLEWTVVILSLGWLGAIIYNMVKQKI